MVADAVVDNSGDLELEVFYCTAEELASRLEAGEYTHRMFHSLASYPKPSLLQMVMPDEDKMRIVCEHACRTIDARSVPRRPGSRAAQTVPAYRRTINSINPAR